MLPHLAPYLEVIVPETGLINPIPWTVEDGACDVIIFCPEYVEYPLAITTFGFTYKALITDSLSENSLSSVEWTCVYAILSMFVLFFSFSLLIISSASSFVER